MLSTFWHFHCGRFLRCYGGHLFLCVLASPLSSSSSSSLLLLLYLLNKLEVGKQIRILNTTQNWVFNKAFRSFAHQTWYMETMLQ